MTPAKTVDNEWRDLRRNVAVENFGRSEFAGAGRKNDVASAQDTYPGAGCPSFNDSSNYLWKAVQRTQQRAFATIARQKRVTVTVEW